MLVLTDKGLYLPASSLQMQMFLSRSGVANAFHLRPNLTEVWAWVCRLLRPFLGSAGKKKEAVMFLDSIYNVSSIMISAFYILFYLTIEETFRALRYTVLLITEEEKRWVLWTREIFIGTGACAQSSCQSRSSYLTSPCSPYTPQSSHLQQHPTLLLPKSCPGTETPGPH